MDGLAVFHRDVFLHLRPDLVRHGDAVAVEIHREGRDDVRLGAEADRGAERLPGQHMGTVELAGDHAIEQHFPVGLRLERHKQSLVLEITVLVGDRERRHVGQLDEPKLQLVLLDGQHLGPGAANEGRTDCRARGQGCGGHQEPAPGQGSEIEVLLGSLGHRRGLPYEKRRQPCLLHQEDRSAALLSAHRGAAIFEITPAGDHWNIRKFRARDSAGYVLPAISKG